MMGLDRREFRLTTALEMLKSHYDYMIIDCAPSLGLLTINALVASSQALVPVQCEYYALEGVAKLLQTIRLVQNGLNADLDVLGILLTMYDPRTSLNQMVVNNARFHFKELVFKTVIPRNIRLAEAPSHGLPIILYDPKSRGAESYFNLAKEFKERVTAI